MDLIDSKYIGLVSSRLPKFKKVKKNLYNFRCPICGDSQKHRNKARGYFYQIKANTNFKCHNCGASTTLSNFLKQVDPILQQQYAMEKFKEGFAGAKGSSTVAKPESLKFEKPKFRDKDICDNLEKISELNTSHSAKRYLIERGIPEECLNNLYYCPTFKTWTNSHKKTFKDTANDDERIIIPLRDTNGSLFGYQGRSLDPVSKMRYITIMLEDKPKIYGLEKVNVSKQVYVVEGPFDSLFLENSVAMAGSDVDIRSFGWCDYIWVYDNEPRNQQIVDRISSAIDGGDKVVIWPCNIQQKDINDMVLAGHDVNALVECNSYQGLEAKLKLSQWKKV